MAMIMLSDKEQQLLIELLEREIPNLRDEILCTPMTPSIGTF